MDQDLRVNSRLVIPGEELWFTASRSSGPGGQNVNKTNTRVSLHWAIGQSRVLTPFQRCRVLFRLQSHVDQTLVIHVHASDTRSQRQNLDLALSRLAALVQQALREPRKRRPSRASKASRERRLETKKRHGSAKALRKRPLGEGE